MLSQTTFEQFKSAVADAKRAGKKVITVAREILGDFITPVMAYKKLATYDGVALLESVFGGKHQGRYSILAVKPYLKFSVKIGQEASVNWVQPGFREFFHPLSMLHQKPLPVLKELLKTYSPLNNKPFFVGGALGYIGHEAISLIEPTVESNFKDDLGLPDISLMFFERVLVFDNDTQGLHIILNLPLSRYEGADFHELAERYYVQATERLDRIEFELEHNELLLNDVDPLQLNVTSSMTQSEYEAMVLIAKEHIANGDVFQVVLSQRFETPFPASRSLDFYQNLCTANPSPYLFHLDFGNDFKLVGASPEVMVGIQSRNVLIRPLAGTRKRGASPEEDIVIAQELANDPKEQAEHRMLVDLARNDVGRFAEPGSVKVEGRMRVEPYGAVLHMATDVRGKLKSRISSFEALLGCLPAGTLSGAPKIRALQIISELEPCQRGPYGGAVGWFTDTDLDTCIFIRSAVITNNKLYWQTGAGIVADSDPTSEYNETLAKSTSIRNVLKQMGGEK